MDINLADDRRRHAADDIGHGGALLDLGRLLLSVGRARGSGARATDPVLAAEVQAKPPGEEEGGEVRFVLTSEARLNDGAAFPFVLLAIALTAAPFQAIWQAWVQGIVKQYRKIITDHLFDDDYL